MQSFAFWLFRSQYGLWFFGALAAKWRFGCQKMQPKRQFAASTPICSPNANSTQLGILQPKRQFAAQTPVRRRFATQRQFAANLQPKRQFAANMQPKRQFAAERQFAAQTPICSPNANSQPIASLQPKSISAAQTHVSRHRLCPCSCFAKRIERNYWGRKVMSVPAHSVRTTREGGL